MNLCAQRGPCIRLHFHDNRTEISFDRFVIKYVHESLINRCQRLPTIRLYVLSNQKRERVRGEGIEIGDGILPIDLSLAMNGRTKIDIVVIIIKYFNVL